MLTTNTDTQLLTKFFLLTIQNLRLNQLSSKTVQLKDNGNRVIEHIQQIQKQICQSLKYKQLKIEQLNQYIRHQHNLNQELSVQMDILQSKYKMLEEKYNKEEQKNKNKHHNTRQHIQKNIKLQQAQQKNQAHEYHIRLLQRQKQQIIHQMQRMRDITIKQLQTDLQILTKENQNLMKTINNYHNQQNRIIQQKNKYEIHLKKYNQQFAEIELILKQNQVENNNLRMENQKLKKNICEEENKYNKELEKVHRNSIDKLSQYQAVISENEVQMEKRSAELRELLTQLQRKSKKLREYDEQYDKYVSKMNALAQQYNNSRSQNIKMKQKYEKIIQEDKQKNQKQQKRINSLDSQLSTLKLTLSEKNKQIQDKIIKVKNQQLKIYENKLKQLRIQYQNRIQQQNLKYAEVEKQRNNAIKQWQQLAQQMRKQKYIIEQLQKQVDICRKANRINVVNQTFTRCTQQQKINYPHIQSVRKQSSISQSQQNNYKFYTQQNLSKKNNLLSVTKQNQYKVDKNKLLISNKNNYQNKNNQQIYEQQQKKQIISHPKLCCKECKTNQFLSVQQNFGQNKDQLVFQQFRPTQLDNNEKKIDKCYLDKVNQKNRLSRQYRYQSQQLQRSSSYHLKDKDGILKYNNHRTKTQQNVNINQNDGRQRYFFRENPKRLPNETISQKQTKKLRISYQTQPNQNKEYYCKNQKAGDNQEKIIRSSSLRNIDYSKKLEQIEQHLSFSVRTGKSKNTKQANNYKLNSQNYPQKLISYRKIQQDQASERAILMQKIGKINSWRDQVQISKQPKIYNFSKKSSAQTSARIKMPNNWMQKENINQLLHRKFQYFTKDGYS